MPKITPQRKCSTHQPNKKDAKHNTVTQIRGAHAHCNENAHLTHTKLVKTTQLCSTRFNITCKQRCNTQTAAWKQIAHQHTNYHCALFSHSSQQKKHHADASMTPPHLLHHCHRDFHHIPGGVTTSVCVFRKFLTTFLSMFPSNFRTAFSFASLLTLSVIRSTLADSSPFLWYAVFASGGGQSRPMSHHAASQKQEDGGAPW